MFKKHMTPLSKNGTLHSGKNPGMQALPAARGGMANMNTYAKATPMAQPEDAPVSDGLGSGSFTGNGVA